LLVARTTAPLQRLPAVHPQAKFVRVKWLGTESFVKVALLDGDDGSDLAKRVHEVLEMGKEGVPLRNVVLYQVVHTGAGQPPWLPKDKDGFDACLATKPPQLVRIIDVDPVGIDSGTLLLATPLFVPGVGECIPAWGQRAIVGGSVCDPPELFARRTRTRDCTRVTRPHARARPLLSPSITHRTHLALPRSRPCHVRV
jgi:hypothetical protein